MQYILLAAAVILFFVLVETGISSWLNSGNDVRTDKGSSKEKRQDVKKKLERKHVS